MYPPANTGAISADNSGGCASLTRNGEAGGEYPDAGTDCGGNTPEVEATVILGLTGVAGSGNGGPVTTGNACLGLGGTLKRNKLPFASLLEQCTPIRSQGGEFINVITPQILGGGEDNRKRRKIYITEANLCNQFQCS
jgi:hypothetical protein